MNNNLKLIIGFKFSSFKFIPSIGPMGVYEISEIVRRCSNTGEGSCEGAPGFCVVCRVQVVLGSGCSCCAEVLSDRVFPSRSWSSERSCRRRCPRCKLGCPAVLHFWLQHPSSELPLPFARLLTDVREICLSAHPFGTLLVLEVDVQHPPFH